jgi:RNA polymerase sigma-70 factor, ECF subfamily
MTIFLTALPAKSAMVDAAIQFRGWGPPDHVGPVLPATGKRQLAEPVQFRRDLIHLLPRLRRFARTLTRDSADADDLVQAACERAIARQAQWQAGTRLDAWVYTLMRNLWISELRKRKVRKGRGTQDAETSDLPAFLASAEDKTFASQIGRMIEALPEGLSSVLLLVGVEERSYAEAAEILDVPIGTVMSRLSRARAALRDQMNRSGVTAMRKA